MGLCGQRFAAVAGHSQCRARCSLRAPKACEGLHVVRDPILGRAKVCAHEPRKVAARVRQHLRVQRRRPSEGARGRSDRSTRLGCTPLATVEGAGILCSDAAGIGAADGCAL